MSIEYTVIDGIIEGYSSMLAGGRFEECDRTLASLEPDTLGRAAIAAILTMTKGCEAKLPSRVKFYMAARESLIRRFDERSTDRLLVGLESGGEG